MKKIIIIGAPGTGKSTLARILHGITNLPVIHLDSLFWKPVWKKTPKSAWIDMQQTLVQNQEWIIDGNYQSTLDIRLQAADVVIFLDIPRRLYIWRVIKRQIFSQGKPRPDLAKGCIQKVTWNYFYDLWNFPITSRALLVEKLLDVSDKKRVIWLTSKKEVTTFIKDLQSAYRTV